MHRNKNDYVKISKGGRFLLDIDDQTILKFLYYTTNFLCVYMISWILIFPSSWLMGRSDLHDSIIDELIVKPSDSNPNLIHPRAVTKYAGQTLIQVTHILPGALWAGAIMFQLYPPLRKKNPKLHKVTGYAFLVTSFLMTFGVVVIFARKLTFIHDYDDIIPPMNDSEIVRFHFLIIFVTTWFAFTAAAAAYKAAIAKDYQSHRNFILRHIGSGIWIAIQRLIVTIAQYGGFVHGGPQQMRSLFGDAGKIGLAITVLSSEYAVRLLNRRQQRVSLSKRKQL